MNLLKKISIFLCFIGIINANDKMQVFQPIGSTCPKSWYEEMKTLTPNLEVVTMMNVKNIKKDVGVPREIQSCNTSFYNDYIIEGNVPIKAIKDFMKDKPKGALGLALPAYENDKNPKTVYVIYENKTYKEFGKY